MWKRVFIPIAVVALIWLVVSGFMTAYVDWLEQSYQQILQQNVTSIEGDAELRTVIWRSRARLAQTTRKVSAAEVDGLRARADKATKMLRDASYLPGEKEFSMAASIKVHDYFEMLDRFISEQKPPAEMATVRKELRMLASSIVDTSRAIHDMNADAITKATERWTYWKGVILAVQAILIIVGPTIGIVLGWSAAKRFRASVSRIDITLSGAVDSERNQFAQVELRPQDDLTRINEKVNHVVSRIHQVTAELNEARQEARRAERLAAVGELAAGVAHEIRNPLTSVKLLLQHAERDSDRRLTQPQLRVILDEVTRIEGTIQGLLDYSRSPTINRRPYDIRTTVRRSLDLVQARARQSGVRMVTMIEEEPLTVDADAEQIHQVLVNLLLNGIESMPSGGILELRAFIPSDDPAAFRIDIFDTGRGIPPTVVGRLFEPFVSTKEGGTGLGLAVCYRIVTEHGGSLTGDNRPGGGAAFTVRLPRSGMRDETDSGNGQAASTAIQPKLTISA